MCSAALRHSAVTVVSTALFTTTLRANSQPCVRSATTTTTNHHNHDLFSSHTESTDTLATRATLSAMLAESKCAAVMLQCAVQKKDAT